MNTKRDWVLKAVVGVALPVLSIVAISDANARPPRSGSATVTRTGPNGNTATRQSNITTNGQGGFNANSTVTGPNGRTATSTTTGSYDPSTKTYTRNTTATGPNGKTATTSATIQATGNGYQRNVTRTGPNGNTATTQGQANYNPATGTLNQSRTITGPNGKSATESRTVTVGAAPQN